MARKVKPDSAYENFFRFALNLVNPKNNIKFNVKRFQKTLGGILGTDYFLDFQIVLIKIHGFPLIYKGTAVGLYEEGFLCKKKENIVFSCQLVK